MGEDQIVQIIAAFVAAWLCDIRTPAGDAVYYDVKLERYFVVCSLLSYRCIRRINPCRIYIGFFLVKF